MIRLIRTIFAVLTRLLFRVPFVILANLFFGLSELFEAIGDGFSHCQKLLKPLSDAPFVLDWKQQLKEMDEERKHRILKQLNKEFDN